MQQQIHPYIYIYSLTPVWTTPLSAQSWISEILSSEGGLIYTISLLSPPPFSSSSSPSLPSTSLPPSPSPPPKETPTIGLLGLSRWDTLTYFLHPSHWSNGYTTEALHAFLRHLFQNEQPERAFVDANIKEGNTASARVLEKCGFKRVEGKWRPESIIKQKRGIDDREVCEEEMGGEEDSLTEETISELKNAVAKMNIQNEPTIEPGRVDIGVETIPTKRVRLIGYRRYQEAP